MPRKGKGLLSHLVSGGEPADDKGTEQIAQGGDGSGDADAAVSPEHGVSATQEPVTGSAQASASDVAPAEDGAQVKGAPTGGNGADTSNAEGSAVDAALSEAQAAERAAAEALAAEDVKVAPPRDNSAAQRERQRPTKEQLMRRAKRERDLGRKLLARRTGGFASRIHQVKLNNYVLAGAFERFFPVIEQSAYLVTRHGAACMGDAGAEKVITRMDELIEEIIKERKKELEAAQAYIGEQSVNMGENFVAPEFTSPAFEETVQVRTPQADRALQIFILSDQLLTEFETLYWNHMRSLSDRNDEALRSKRVVRPLFAFAGRTTVSLYRRMHTKAGRPDEGREQPVASATQAGAEAAPVVQPNAGLEPEREVALAAG